jgi:ZIP family zinc transporter
MWQAILWGGVSGSAVMLGALAAIYLKIKRTYVGYIMAFGTGVLMGAAAYELLGHSAEDGGILPAASGFLAGAVVFTLFELLISHKGGKLRKRTDQKHSAAASGESSIGIAIFFGTMLDAIPESFMIGASAKEGNISWLLVIAIFLSNFPEGLSSTVGLKRSHYPLVKILAMWTSVLIAAALSSAAGYYFQEILSEQALAGIAAFAGGGIIAMLASTMLPEAYEEGGPLIGLITAAGLLVSMVLDRLAA